MDTKSVIVKALEIDGEVLSSSPAKFGQVNEFQYSLAVETWFHVLNHVAGEKAVIAVSFDVIRHGLVATIADAVSVSNALVHGADVTSLPAVWCWVCQNLNMRSALQVLRYLKRFTPIGCDKLDDACIQAYISRLNCNKLRDRKEACRYITSRAHEVCCEIMNGFTLGREMPNGIPATFFEEGYFSSGVTWDATPNCLASKVNAWVSPFFGDPLYPTTNEGTLVSPSGKHILPRHRCRGLGSYWTSPWLHLAVAKCVPKSYKAKRIIAEEETERQFYMQGMRNLVRKHISNTTFAKNLELDRQESQQRRCFDKRWATLDLSSASDTITVSLAADILPDYLYQISSTLRSSLVDVNGTHYLNTIYQTSGSAWCFDAESMIFYSICEACQRWKAVYTGEEYVPVYVYGDDIEVDVRCYTECIEWLSALGFVVNEDKSFGPDTLYRESCGVEVLDEFEVSTAYWPRKEITNSKASLQSLISLSDRLIDVDWIGSHMIVLDAIHTICGDKFTTTSVLESGYVTDCRTLVTPITKHVPSRKWYAGDVDTPDYEGHMYVSDSYQDRLGGCINDLDTYRYTQFLLHGPRFVDGLSSLINVSTSIKDNKDTRCNARVALSIQPRI